MFWTEEIVSGDVVEMEDNIGLQNIDFDKGGGLVPAIVQDYVSGEVLMVAYVNREALKRTIETGYAHFWSRSRNKLWLKGETSGNKLRVVNVLVDCDTDTIIYLVIPSGPACHTGNKTCFFRVLKESGEIYDKFEREIIEELVQYFKRSWIEERDWVKDNKRSHYNYVVNPITDNIPPPSPEVVSWLARKIHEMTADDIDKVVVPEALGIPIASLVANLKKKPLAVIRKRWFSDKGLLSVVEYASGYESGKYYIYGVEKGDRVLIVDDAISTGGTLIPIIKNLEENQVDIRDIICILEKPDYGGKDNVYKMTGKNVKTLIKLKMENNEIKYIEIDGYKVIL